MTEDGQDANIVFRKGTIAGLEPKGKGRVECVTAYDAEITSLETNLELAQAKIKQLEVVVDAAEKFIDFLKSTVEWERHNGDWPAYLNLCDALAELRKKGDSSPDTVTSNG